MEALAQRTTRKGAHAPSKPKSQPQSARVQSNLNGLSFVTQIHDKHGEYISTCFFDVPQETYEAGWHTGMRIAAEFMAAMQKKTLKINALDVMREAARATEEDVNGVNRRGAAVGFLRMLEDMLLWSAITAPHKTYIADRIERQRQADARLDAVGGAA
jgi:hypothetical protein